MYSTGEQSGQTQTLLELLEIKEEQEEVNKKAQNERMKLHGAKDKREDERLARGHCCPPQTDSTNTMMYFRQTTMQTPLTP